MKVKVELHPPEEVEINPEDELEEEDAMVVPDELEEEINPEEDDDANKQLGLTSQVLPPPA